MKTIGLILLLWLCAVLAGCSNTAGASPAVPTIFSFSNISGAGGTARATTSHDKLKLIGMTINPTTKTISVTMPYTEGTWTPLVIGSSLPGTATYTAQCGRYTRIGNRIFFSATVGWSAHTGTGTLAISLPPYRANNSDVWNVQSVSVLHDGLVVGVGKIPVAQISPNGQYAYFKACDQSGGAISDIAMDTSVDFVTISGFYEI